METLKEKLKQAIINNTVQSIDKRYSIPEYFYDNLKRDLLNIAIESQIELIDYLYIIFARTESQKKIFIKKKIELELQLNKE